MDIAIDFDGTCTSHDYPRVGKEIGAPRVLKRLVDKGHRLILFTMRSNLKEVVVPIDSGLHPKAGNYLDDAVNWFKSHNIPLYGIQINPSQLNWTTSPKCYAQLYIDDAALGCPLVHPKDGRPYVDWYKIEELLEEMGVLYE